MIAIPELEWKSAGQFANAPGGFYNLVLNAATRKWELEFISYAATSPPEKLGIFDTEDEAKAAARTHVGDDG